MNEYLVFVIFLIVAIAYYGWKIAVMETKIKRLEDRVDALFQYIDLISTIDRAEQIGKYKVKYIAPINPLRSGRDPRYEYPEGAKSLDDFWAQARNTPTEEREEHE